MCNLCLLIKYKKVIDEERCFVEGLKHVSGDGFVALENHPRVKSYFYSLKSFADLRSRLSDVEATEWNLVGDLVEDYCGCSDKGNFFPQEDIDIIVSTWS